MFGALSDSEVNNSVVFNEGLKNCQLDNTNTDCLIDERFQITIIGGLFYYVLLGLLYTISLYGRITNSNSTEWRTPILDVTVIDVSYSPNYEIAYIYEVVTVYLVSSIVCFSNVLIAAILIDMCTQFKIFNHYIETTFQNILKDNNDINEVSVGWPILQKSISEVVQRHLFLIKIMDDVEMACSTPVFVDVIANILIICCSGYYASVLPLFDPKAFQSYFEIVAVTLSLFLVSYFGSEVTIVLEAIADTCYGLDFIGTDLRFQKSLVMIMKRSQKPIRITVGGFVALSIAVFVTTCDMMWKPRQIGSKTLTFEMLKEKKILRIEDMCGNEVYLGWESVSEVWSLETVLRL
ncbi:hypothetical protein FQA39_LY13306 [Lamprigera yunnana]|nr:hypothetical protein FQA39_LY13306 [Lamprigera yunnana]